MTFLAILWSIPILLILAGLAIWADDRKKG